MTHPSRRAGEASQLAVSAYGLLGDCRSAALSSPAGSIDWWCVPRFDDEPVFARLVAGEDGGCFEIGPADDATLLGRGYVGDSPMLRSTWRSGEAELELTEGLVGEVSGRLLPASLLVRRVTCTGGPVQIRVRFDPRYDGERRRPRVSVRSGALVCTWGADALALTCDASTAVAPGADHVLTVEPGKPVTFAVSVAVREPLVIVPPDVAWAELEASRRWWQGWAESLRVDVGRWSPAVVRSLITLRLLTYAASGAPVAAPTTSLPEVLGGVRNWDYRFAWPRDASIGIAAFLAAGRPEEARAFLYWLLHATRLHRPRLPALLSLDGRGVPAQRELDWPGFAGSRPVRFGNDARDQHQLDGYGWVLDAAWLLVDAGHRLFAETWRALGGFADQVASRWAEPDSGIWEVPGPPRQWVHSKLMGWLALDRALRIARTHRTRGRRLARWACARDALAAEIRARGVDPDRGCLVREYGGSELDAALLILPVLEFVDADDPMVRHTIEAVRAQLGDGGDLMYRYPPGSDGLPGGEGAFLPCSFWLVQALARTGGVDEAAALFDRLLDRGGPLGLFAEEVDVNTGLQIGNYPQAFSHATLVQAALSLADATADRAAPRAARRTRREPRS
jgi:GH15 family glucan-1,4-alpha-glucosidase